jgi:hypothetical protein
MSAPPNRNAYVQRFVDLLKQLISDESTPHDAAWAYHTCTETRRIHESVWEACPDRKWVRREVLPLFEEAAAAVDAIEGDSQYPLAAFAGNIRFRASNLNRYVEGIHSSFGFPDLLDPTQLPHLPIPLLDLSEELKDIAPGRQGWPRYERLVGETIRTCFGRALTNLEPQVCEIDGIIRRDWVAAITAERGFWGMVRTRYSSTQIIWECKNERKLTAEDFHQVAYYLGTAIGRFGVLSFRGTMKRHLYQHIRRISTSADGMVLVLTDEDLRLLWDRAQHGLAPEEVLKDVYDRTVRAVS